MHQRAVPQLLHFQRPDDRTGAASTSTVDGHQQLNQIVGYSKTCRRHHTYPGGRAHQRNAHRSDPSNATAYDSEAVAINNAGEFGEPKRGHLPETATASLKTISYACRGANWYPPVYSAARRKHTLRIPRHGR